MRILMVTDFYWPFLGGVEQHVRHLSQALTERGHEVAVVTLRGPGLAASELDGRVRVYRIRSSMQRASRLFSRPERAWAPPFPDPEASLALKRILSHEKPDIVHGHDWLARSFAPLKLGSKAKFVMSLHYYTVSCAKKSLMYNGAPCAGPSPGRCPGCAARHYGAIKGISVLSANWIMRAVDRTLVDVFLPVSRAVAGGNGLTESDKYRVIPNFIAGDPGAAPGVEPYLSQLPAEPFLLFVGDLRYEKGVEVLLSAYAGLHAPPPLVLIGKTWSDTPEVLPPGTILLKDWPNEAVLAAWKRSLVAIVPSVWPEPFGLVIIEAMSSGRPVIASRVGGIPDIVLDGETGLLVPPGDPAALRLAIERLLGEPALREKMGQAAQARAAAFQSAAVVPQIERVYRQLLQGKLETHAPTASGEYYS